LLEIRAGGGQGTLANSENILGSPFMRVQTSLLEEKFSQN
jgi:hypothetical protein